MTVLEVRDVGRCFGAVRAVAGLTFDVRAGECVGLLGLNGAGKTTTLRMLAGVLASSEGGIRLDGERLAPDAPDVRARIGYLPERPPLYDGMRVDAYLGFAARLRGLRGADVAGAVTAALEQTDLLAVAAQPIASLSHGFRQRVGLAQAIVHGPSLVILDEPSQGLDPAQSHRMRQLICALKRRYAVLLSTHLLRDVENVCDRVLVMHRGQLLAQGTDTELSERFATGAACHVRIEARGEAARIAEVLRVVPSVVSVAIADRGRFDVDSEHDVRAALNRAVIEAGFELVGCAPREDVLMDLFARLTRDGSAS